MNAIDPTLSTKVCKKAMTNLEPYIAYVPLVKLTFRQL